MRHHRSGHRGGSDACQQRHQEGCGCCHAAETEAPAFPERRPDLRLAGSKSYGSLHTLKQTGRGCLVNYLPQNVCREDMALRG